MRQGAAGLVFRKCFAPQLHGKTFTDEELKFYEVYLHRSLTMMERWLTVTSYLCGNEVTIADISAAHELEQLRFIERDLSKYPKVKAWLHKVIDEDPVQLETVTRMREMAVNFNRRAKL